MVYSIEWHPKTRIVLRKLHPFLAKRITKKIYSIKEDPFHYLEHYEGEKVYKLRIGDYRTLVDVDLKRKIIFVRVINHRKKIYKRGY